MNRPRTAGSLKPAPGSTGNRPSTSGSGVAPSERESAPTQAVTPWEVFSEDTNMCDTLTHFSQAGIGGAVRDNAGGQLLNQLSPQRHPAWKEGFEKQLAASQEKKERLLNNPERSRRTRILQAKDIGMAFSPKASPTLRPPTGLPSRGTFGPPKLYMFQSARSLCITSCAIIRECTATS
eukprot:401798-Prorocentrum_minimum.AAC.4